jgi:hypothetical protein
MRFRYPNVSYGLIAYITSLFGTFLVANELARLWAVFVLTSAAALAVIAWGRQEWIPGFHAILLLGYPVSIAAAFSIGSE